MNEINFELQEIADNLKLEEIQALYQEMVDEMLAEHYMRTYEAHSYDADCVAYGL